MKMRRDDPRRQVWSRGGDIERTLGEFDARAEALGLVLHQWAVPTLQLAVDILVDAKQVARELRHASLILERELPRPRAARRPRRSDLSTRATRVGKVRKAFWLDPRLLDEARVSLGASSEREAIEMALDLVKFRRELLRGTRALLGLEFSRID